MSIKNDIVELDQINTEIKRLYTEMRVLRKRAKNIEDRILIYLKEKDQPGLKYNNTAVVVENKDRALPKKKSESEHDIIRVLRDNGVDDPLSVYKQINEAKKGEIVEKQKLRFKKLM